MVSLGWPAFDDEELPWEATNLDLVPRRHHAVLRTPYRGTIAPPIAKISEIPISSAVAASLAEAEAQIARFDERLGSTLAAFAAVALRTEAASSSQIENLSASASSIAVAEHSAPTTSPVKPNAELIVSNVRSLQHAGRSKGPVTVAEIIDIQRVLLEPSAPRLTGTFRHEPVWIGGTAYSPHGADHVAPHHQRVPAAIDDLVTFMDRSDLSPLALIAIAHAQFENIHPFPDGNGRTGRALVQRMLGTSGLVRRSLLPISAGLLGAIPEYFKALSSYRDGELEPILAVFGDATFSAVSNSTQLADQLAGIRDTWSAEITARSHSNIWAALDLCVVQPAITADELVARLGLSAATAYRVINRLADEGVIRQNSKAKRNQVWLVADVIEAVEQFMDRALRRAEWSTNAKRSQ